MKLVIFSDTHNRHEKMRPLPKGDVLIFCGDAQRTGFDDGELIEFNIWLGEQPFDHRIVIAGNHDRILEHDGVEGSQDIYFNATYLQDSGCEIDGVKFWGSPWQPEFNNWAFNLSRGKALKEKWDLIPDDTDVLITHAPPQGYFDECIAFPIQKRFGRPITEHAGCEELAKAVRRIKPKVHCFGHIHDGGGNVLQDGNTLFVNAAICTPKMAPTNPPIVVEI